MENKAIKKETNGDDEKNNGVGLLGMAENLFDQAVEAKSYWMVLKQYEDCLDEYNDEMNVSPGFYWITSQALANSLLLTLAKLYENPKDKQITLSKLMKNFRELAERNMLDSFFAEEVKKYQIEYHSLKDAIEMLRNVRNKYIAHNDQNINFDIGKLNEKIPLKRKQKEALVDFGCRYTQMCVSALSGRYVADVVLGSDDWIESLRYVRRGRQEDLAETGDSAYTEE